nr:hypothetical protein [Tanacetum cinerariifolium]
MTKKPSIPKRNKVNWHYIRDDILFSTIKMVSRHQNTQQYGAILPIELTTEDIWNTKAYKEYYACATGEAAPKPKASARRKRSNSDTSITPPTATPTPITTNDESDDGKEDDDDDDQDDDDDDNDDEEEIAKIDEPEDTKSGGDSKDDGNGEEEQGLRVSEEQRIIEEEEADELYRDQESSSVSSFMTSMLNPISDAGVESIFTTASSSVAPLPTPIPTMTPSIITTITTASHPPIPPTPIPSEVLQNLPTFDSVFHFNERLKSLEASFSEYRQTNPFAEAVSNIPGIVHQYMNQQMHEAVRVAVQIQTDWLNHSYQKENNEFLKTIDDNMKRIIKEQVKSQIQDQVSRILPRIEQSVNAQLESKVLTRSSHSSRTSYAVATDLSEMELKKILIEKMEGNKSTTGTQSRQMSASESAFAEEPVQTTCQMDEPSHSVIETDTPIDFSNFIMNRLCVDTLPPELLAGLTYELMKGSCNILTELEYHLEEVYKATMDQLDWVNPEGQQYPHNLL